MSFLRDQGVVVARKAAPVPSASPSRAINENKGERVIDCKATLKARLSADVLAASAASSTPAPVGNALTTISVGGKRKRGHKDQTHFNPKSKGGVGRRVVIE